MQQPSRLYGAAYGIVVTTFALILAIGGVTPTAAQQPVSVSSSALPAGAATSDRQEIANASLASLDGKFSDAGSLADDTANPSTSKIAAYNMCFDGTAWDRCRASIDGTHGNDVSAGGPQVVAEAVLDMSANTLVADGKAVRFAADGLGRLLSGSPCDRSARVGGVTTVTDGSSTSAVAAGGAGIYTEVYDVVIGNTSATAVTVDVRDGTAGSVLGTFPAPANTSGIVYSFKVPLTSSANTAIAVDPSAAASSVIVTLRGCKAK